MKTQARLSELVSKQPERAEKSVRSLTHTHSTAHRTAGTDINGDSLTCSFILLAFKALTFPEEWGKWVCAAAVSEPNFLQFRTPSLSGEALTLDGCQTSAVFQDGTQL